MGLHICQILSWCDRMLRNVEFRGWSKNGWVYGFYVKCRGHSYILEAPYFSTTPRTFVKLESVGQYCGQEDCDGVKIYEGDILAYEDGSSGVVRWIDDDEVSKFVIELSNCDVVDFAEEWIVAGNEWEG